MFEITDISPEHIKAIGLYIVLPICVMVAWIKTQVTVFGTKKDEDHN